MYYNNYNIRHAQMHCYSIIYYPTDKSGIAVKVLTLNRTMLSGII